MTYNIALVIKALEAYAMVRDALNIPLAVITEDSLHAWNVQGYPFTAIHHKEGWKVAMAEPRHDLIHGHKCIKHSQWGAWASYIASAFPQTTLPLHPFEEAPSTLRRAQWVLVEHLPHPSPDTPIFNPATIDRDVWISCPLGPPDITNTHRNKIPRRRIKAWRDKRLIDNQWTWGVLDTDGTALSRPVQTLYANGFKAMNDATLWMVAGFDDPNRRPLLPLNDIAPVALLGIVIQRDFEEKVTTIQLRWSDGSSYTITKETGRAAIRASVNLDCLGCFDDMPFTAWNGECHYSDYHLAHSIQKMLAVPPHELIPRIKRWMERQGPAHSFNLTPNLNDILGLVETPR